SVIYPGDTIALSGSGNTAVAATVSASTSVTPASPAPAAEVASSTNNSSASNVSLASSGYSEIPATSTNAAILASANAQLGAGAIQDCTVLGEQALRAAGISGVGDESPESLMGYATQVSNPQPGDFIYYADGGLGFSHNAVYIGGGQAIHSGWNGNQTVIKSVDVGSGPVYYRVNG
ncbi:NlpC/P60 family protein, partial [Arthrobacter sp. H14]|uniref:NlpC/P60 family protein n=1 Tax=Arthrobacter sp. H14 TaxID=1312959 RepID=UPI001565A677